MTTRDFQFESASLGETRTVTVFLPPAHSHKIEYPAVFCADGQAVHGFSRRLDRAIEEDRAPPVILIGVHSSDRFRANEYIEGIDHQRFEAHEQFFADDIFRWAIKELNVSPARQSCGVFGFSNGGAFALSMGFRHRDRYGVVIAFSIAGGAGRFERSEYASRPTARYYLSAGTKEKPLLKTSRAVARLLAKHGIEHTCTERCAGHDFSYWDSELPEAIRWAFPMSRDKGWL